MRQRSVWALALCASLAIAPAQAADLSSSAWQGEYDCAQGATGLSLMLSPAPPSGTGTAQAVRATFHFYALPANPAVPEGCYEMRGTVDPAANRIALRASRWVLRPFGYVMVDLTGTVALDGQSITGTVGGPGCTAFRVHRVDPADAALPNACRAPAIALAK